MVSHLISLQIFFEAFAAIVGDGRVVTWGHPNSGGVCGLEENTGTKITVKAVSALGQTQGNALA